MKNSLHCYEGHSPREIRETCCLQTAGMYRGHENKCSYVKNHADST